MDDTAVKWRATYRADITPEMQTLSGGYPGVPTYADRDGEFSKMLADGIQHWFVRVEGFQSFKLYYTPLWIKP